MTGNVTPRFAGVSGYQDPDGAYQINYSSDWRLFSLPEGMDGILIAPERENPKTWVSIWKTLLPDNVRADDVGYLKEGLNQGLQQLAECEIISQSEEVVGNMIKLERIVTFTEEGQRRKRKLWVLYSRKVQLSIAFQGATESEYERWLSMANYSFHTLNLPLDIWSANERDLIGWRSDSPEARHAEDFQSSRVRLDWYELAGQYRLPVSVSATGFERFERPVEMVLQPGSYLPASEKPHRPVRVVEIDGAGKLLDPNVTYQFDVFGSLVNGGRLIFWMKGNTPANQVRHYQVYLAASETISSIALHQPLITVEDGVWHEDQESYKIQTPEAIYYYHKQGAGFASLEDRDGRDWIGYHPGGRSAGEFRGIPNMVHPEGYFHPGGTNCKSAIVGRGPLKVTIYSESQDGKWACIWEIYPYFANLTLLRAAKAYWFLYEGTPGGTLDLENGYMVRSPGVRTPLAELWNEISPGPKWVYFGSTLHNRVLYIVNKIEGDSQDSYWPMNGEMTVFGFGRLKLQSFLDQAPAYFTVGLADGGDAGAIERTIDSVWRDIQIVLGRIESKA